MIITGGSGNERYRNSKLHNSVVQNAILGSTQSNEHLGIAVMISILLSFWIVMGCSVVLALIIAVLGEHKYRWPEHEMWRCGKIILQPLGRLDFCIFIVD